MINISSLSAVATGGVSSITPCPPSRFTASDVWSLKMTFDDARAFQRPGWEGGRAGGREGGGGKQSVGMGSTERRKSKMSKMAFGLPLHDVALELKL